MPLGPACSRRSTKSRSDNFEDSGSAATPPINGARRWTALVKARQTFAISGHLPGKWSDASRDNLGKVRPGHFRHSLIGHAQIDRILAPEDFKRFFPRTSLENGAAEFFEHCDRVHQTRVSSFTAKIVSGRNAFVAVTGRDQPVATTFWQRAAKLGRRTAAFPAMQDETPAALYTVTPNWIWKSPTLSATPRSRSNRSLNRDPRKRKIQ